MKKRTDAEMREAVEIACELINNAREQIRDATKLLHHCGIRICDSINANAVPEWETYGSNVQIFRGIDKLSKLTGAVGFGSSGK